MNDALTKAMMEYPAARQVAESHGYCLVQHNSGHYDLVAPNRKGNTRLVIYPKRHAILAPVNKESKGIRKWPFVPFDKDKFSLIDIVQTAIDVLSEVKR